MATFIIGLTGGIGSGKTTVSDLFASLGIEIVDADVVARSVVEKGSEALERIVSHFGKEILLDDGTLNRALLRSKIFADEEEKIWLNNLLHPVIRTSMLKKLNECNGDYCILSAPLLFENNLQSIVNRSLVVDVSLESQIERTCKRDSSNIEQIKAIIASQHPREKRLAMSDDIIDNESPDLNELKLKVVMLDKKYRDLASTFIND